MRRNTMSFAGYLKTVLLWCVPWFFLQVNTFFHTVFGRTHTTSVTIFACWAAVGCLVGFLTTFRTRRNYASILCIVALTFGPYFLVSFWPFARSPLTVAGQIAAALLACYTLLVFLTYLSDRRAGVTAASFGKCLSSCLRANVRLALILLGLLLCFVMIKTTLHVPLLSPSDTTANTDTYASRRDSVRKNADALLPLVDGRWDQLSAAERLDVLSVIGSIEAAHLNIPEVDIGSDLFDRRFLGHYKHSSQTISINLAYLPNLSAYDALSTLCHEYTHAYQHRLVQLYDTLPPEAQALPYFNDVEQYKFEFENYADGTDNHDEYASQLCEQHSDLYGEISADRYLTYLREYLHEQEE